jgi:CRISPR-associated protein Csd1
MLFTRLAEHAAHRTDLPPAYYRTRMIRWAISVRSDGSPAARKLQDLASSEQPAGVPIAAPYVYRSGQRPPPMLLADTLHYVAALPVADTGKAQAEADRRNREYVALLARWRDSAPDDAVAAAVLKFFEAGHHRTIKVPMEVKASDLVAIMVGSQWAHQRESAASFWASVVQERKGSTAGTGICLVCGREGPLLDTIPEAVNSGAIPAGTRRGRDAQLVSVNKPAQGRGGKLQLASAPVCDRCGSAAMSALNALLADPAHRYRSADSVLTWWLREPAEFNPLEWLSQPEPDQVRKLIGELSSPHHRAAAGGVDTNAFYALTLSVNRSRVVVHDWLEVPLSQVQRRIGGWFADHQMADLWHDGPQVVPLWLLARSAGRSGTENGQQRYLAAAMLHGCERDLLLTALKGTRPPGYLLPHLLQRIRADGRVDLPRAALLRLILTRTPHIPKETCMPSLDPGAPYPAYQCGRMFAVLEQIQRAALGGDINTTIADKYLPAATTTPRAVLVMLQKNSSGHLRRLRRTNTGAYYALNSRLDEVLGHLDAGRNIPPVLDIEGQAQFILGYHHQRAHDLAAARAHAHQQPAAASS